MSLPDPMPRVTPAEATAIALSLCLGQRIGANSGTVQFVVHAIEKAGWRIVSAQSEEAKGATVIKFPPAKQA